MHVSKKFDVIENLKKFLVFSEALQNPLPTRDPGPPQHHTTASYCALSTASQPLSSLSR